ncbi:MAG: ABC transporter permease [Oscillospiraceae bacterium]|jgi:putative ABC transport system permease protein|nr:ABC transporter permease [Oscillospiraceae bacterium]
MNVLRVTLEEGLMYALLAIGVYITYSILDFPDLSVDGTMPMGAIVTAVLIIHGVNPWLCLAITFALGMACGAVTGLLHVKLNIRPLLCGIIVYTAMLSLNLVILFKGNNGITVASFFKKPTIFNSGIAEFFPEKWKVVILSLILVVICKIIMDFYLKTKSGLLLRATGDNERYVTMLAKDPGYTKILGLAIGNGFAALSGCVIAQQKGSADQQMGVGMVVLGLASVIIGLSVFKKVKFMKATTMVILGSILYKAFLSAALAMNLPTEYLKLLMAVLFTLALVFSEKFKGKKKRA